MPQKQTFPPQHQTQQPGQEHLMHPQPVEEDPHYRAAGKLVGKVALITGGDSGIGRAIAILYAKEGAEVAILYLNEHEDAHTTQRRVEELGSRCLLLAGDVGDKAFCQQAVQQVLEAFGHLDILVNNAAEQHVQERFEDIKEAQLRQTFQTNLFGIVFLTQAALPHLGEGSVIINTASVTAYKGFEPLIDYSATKGAIITLTRSLSQQLIQRGIRVNAVAPGPIWTPLIPASFPEEQVAEFGTDTPMGRAGQPAEVAPCYVFLACNDSSYMAGQVLHPNGGRIVAS